MESVIASARARASAWRLAPVTLIRVVDTMNFYAHVVQDTQRQAVSHLDRMLKRQRPDRG
ncbi:hypothetical protein ACH4LZ_14010 [Streptomyces halstedii]|uniref:hypothetical protein n=1 Tax=Streptomyces halstedii TaxID=1944 RepID=UPI0037A3FC71